MPPTRQNTSIPPINKGPRIWQEIKELKRLPPRTGNGPLSVLEELAILDGMDCGLSVSWIANGYGLSLGSVKRFKSGILRDPVSVFRLPVIRRFGKGQFQCRVCGEPRCTLSRVQRHVMNHFVSYEIAKNIDLNDIPEVQ